MNKDFKKGMKVKKIIECLMCLSQLFILALIVICIIAYIKKYKQRHSILLVFVLIYLTRFLNPISTQAGLCKAQESVIKKYI